MFSGLGGEQHGFDSTLMMMMMMMSEFYTLWEVKN
jgi:hypothetical protein